VEKIQRNLQWHREQKIRYQTDIENEDLALVNNKAEISILQDEANSIKTELANYAIALEALPLDELQAQNTYWKTNVAVIEQALLDASNRQQEKKARLKQGEENLAVIMSRAAQLELDIRNINENMGKSSGEETQIAELIAELDKTVIPNEDQLTVGKRT
jgi:chromosome segregation ATPase